MARIAKLISGGQAGAERAALDVAIRNGFPHGGCCTNGRMADDGPIGGQYQVDETSGNGHKQYIEWNILDSDGTVVFSRNKNESVDVLQAIDFACMHKKPYLHVWRGQSYGDPALTLQWFVQEHGVKVLNVAGSRECEDPGIWLRVYQVIEDAFFWGNAHRGMLGGPGEG